MKSIDCYEESHYRSDHFLAKVIVYIAYLTIGLASTALDNPFLVLSVGTWIWLFGVNSVAYLIESIAEHPHRHHRI